MKLEASYSCNFAKNEFLRTRYFKEFVLESKKQDVPMAYFVRGNFPGNKYMFKVKNRNFRTRCVIS